MSPARRRLLDPKMTGAVVIDIKYEDVFIVVFILFLWGIVLRIFFLRWGMLGIKLHAVSMSKWSFYILQWSY